MYGFDKSYAELLELSGFDTLKTRREKALSRFTEKSLNNPIYSHWFQENNNPRQSQRHGKKYEEKFARTNRLYNSPLYTARRNLNETASEKPESEAAYDYHLNDPFVL